MKYRILILGCVAGIALTGCSQKTTESPTGGDGLSAFSADSLGKNISVLASDDFQGRKPFTEGETKTVQFLEQKFAAMGLEPGNGNSYVQDVPMVNIATEASPSMQVQGTKGSFELKGFTDYVIWTEKTDSVISLNKDELVFAGYGVVAPEYNWNDYAGLDAKGKIVLVMVNDPGFRVDQRLFKGDTMTYYGRWTYKFEEAARQGAKGCLIIHTTKGASYPFSVVQNNWNGSRLRLDDRGKEQKYCSTVGWVTQQTAQRLLSAAGKDTTLYAQANKPGFKPVPLGVKLSTSIKVKATFNKSHNVIAKITGSKHPDEYIIYTAHWDHLGIGKPDETGDSIYNGALDNASATAGLFELARGFKSLADKPTRTVVFLSVTAEEQGLWGSAYYALNPVYPLNKTVANINMDVLNSYGKTKDIVIVGRNQSQLEDYLKEAAEKKDRVISFETHPESGYYYRSDHFNFAKAGVPALYINNGIDVVDKGKEYGQQKADEYTKQHYHRPSDEYNAATWNLEGAIGDLQLLFEVGKRLTSEEKWPEWKQGSEFKAIRDKSIANP
ncbi:M28 family metallopeptidase [Xanthocytophaga agilis]|uniref:M28 family metallopeptidase n=1 Tax=Xanthocytophaga agilis TaxID=3048010 RepID=A0AAE3RCZ9_9BACT|nr:M28 family metallopeptidase [Xanthocytophaga agilis]MDJ1506292.1 M28 family metallopeptidase [Xanthocytophaga agilis]